MENVSVLPLWKKGASLSERLAEMSLYARAHPERFERFVMAYLERLPNGNLKIRHMSFGCDLPQELGMYELGKSEALSESRA